MIKWIVGIVLLAALTFAVINCDASRYRFTSSYGRDDPVYSMLKANDQQHAHTRYYELVYSSDGFGRYTPSHNFASKFAEKMLEGKSERYSREYAINIAQGESAEYAHAFAEHYDRIGIPIYAYYYAENIDRDRDRTNINNTMRHEYNVAVALAMYSTRDHSEAEGRSIAARRIRDVIAEGDMDTDTALELLNDIVPDSTLEERKAAAKRLASISEEIDGELTMGHTVEIGNELTKLIIGQEIDAEERVRAARQMISLTQSNDLNPDNAAELMEIIAPEWSVTERKEALGYLAWQLSDGDWNPDSVKRTAEEGYTLITGGQLQLEKRVEAGVKLVGEGLKRYGGDSFDDVSISQTEAAITSAFRGDFNLASAREILEFGESQSRTKSGQTGVSRYDLIKETIESQMYRQVEKIGWSFRPINEEYPVFTDRSIDVKGCSRHDSYRYKEYDPVRGLAYWYSSTFTSELVTNGKSSEYAHAYASYKRKNAIVCYKSQVYGYQDWDYCDNDSVVEVDRDTIVDHDMADAYARAYVRAFNTHNESPIFAHAYANARIGCKSVTEAESIAESVAYHNIPTYADFYDEAITSGKTHTYGLQYADLRVLGESSEYADAYAEQFVVAGKTERYSTIYAEEVDSGNSTTYARAYAEQIVVADKSETFSRIFAGEIAADRDMAYADAYAGKLSAGYSEIYSRVYAGQISLGRPKEYARAYVEAFTGPFREDGFRTDSETRSIVYASTYTDQRARGKTAGYARTYAKWIAAGRPSWNAHIYAVMFAGK